MLFSSCLATVTSPSDSIYITRPTPPIIRWYNPYYYNPGYYYSPYFYRPAPPPRPSYYGPRQQRPRR